eukprot:6186133-Pleurochrysis_carterae.AAC.3
MLRALPSADKSVGSMRERKLKAHGGRVRGLGEGPGEGGPHGHVGATSVMAAPASIAAETIGADSAQHFERDAHSTAVESDLECRSRLHVEADLACCSGRSGARVRSETDWMQTGLRSTPGQKQLEDSGCIGPLLKRMPVASATSVRVRASIGNLLAARTFAVCTLVRTLSTCAEASAAASDAEVCGTSSGCSLCVSCT